LKKYKFSIPFLAAELSLSFAVSIVLAAHLSYFQGFETDTTGWSGATRVPSGTNSVVSASGNFHAEAGGGAANAAGAYTNWGGYGGNAGCFTAACAAASFPQDGYVTSIDIWLDPLAATANDTRFDFSSAISDPAGSHRRDFVFNAGFYNDTDTTGTGPRFVISASNNATRSGAYPKNPGSDPFVIIDDGWYTFQHTFRGDVNGILTVELSIKDSAGITQHTWTLSDPSDTINGTVGSNRYGWFALQEFPVLAFDNSQRSDILSTPVDKEQCKKDGWRQLVNGNGDAFTNQGRCVRFVITGN
jgi:hypothetical protein